MQTYISIWSINFWLVYFSHGLNASNCVQFVHNWPWSHTVTRNATTQCWKKAFPWLLLLARSEHLFLRFVYIEKLATWSDCTVDIWPFMLEASLWWFSSVTWISPFQKFSILFNRSLSSCFYQKIQRKPCRMTEKTIVKWIRKTQNGTKLKSSTQTNQQLIVQMRSHSGYSCTITIFKSTFKVWNK